MIHNCDLITTDQAGIDVFSDQIKKHGEHGLRFIKNFSFDIHKFKDFDFEKERYDLLIIEDEWDNIAPILYAIFTENLPEVNGVLIITSAEIAKYALSKNLIPPKVITLDFRLGETLHFQKETLSIYKTIRKKFMVAPVIGITNFEKEDEAKPIVDLMRKNKDSVYSKSSSLWSVLPNIIRNKLSIGHLKEHNHYLNHENTQLRKDLSEKYERKPEIFIGSSGEALGLAKAIKFNLRKIANCEVWDNAFHIGDILLDQLIEKTQKVDYAIFVFHPSDIVISKNQLNETVRDNVVFETGLFMSKIGRKNVFIALPERHKDIKILTDLDGFMMSHYEESYERNYKITTENFCFEIEERIKKDKLEKQKKINEGFQKEKSFDQRFDILHE